MQKLSTAAAVPAAEKFTEKLRNFVNLHFITYNIKKYIFFIEI